MCFCFCLVFSNRWQNDLLFYCLKLFCLFVFSRQQFLICLSFVFTGSPVSFENAILYDQVYQQTLAAVMFIVWLDMLKPLTFNSHLHILYFSLTKGRKEMLSFMLFFLIAISAFASYLHVTDGYVVLRLSKSYHISFNNAADFISHDFSEETSWTIISSFSNCHFGVCIRNDFCVYKLFHFYAELLLF